MQEHATRISLKIEIAFLCTKIRLERRKRDATAIVLAIFRVILSGHLNLLTNEKAIGSEIKRGSLGRCEAADKRKLILHEPRKYLRTLKPCLF